MRQLPECTTRWCCASIVRQQGVDHTQAEGTIPWPLEDWRLDVVLVTELWGSRRLLSRGRVGSVHLQSYITQDVEYFIWNFENLTLRVTNITGHQCKFTYGANLCVAGCVSFWFLLLLFLFYALFLHIPYRHLALHFPLFLIYKIDTECYKLLQRGGKKHTQTFKKGNDGSIPAGELPLLETLWERIVAIQPSTSTDANFLRSKNKREEFQLGTCCCLLKRVEIFGVQSNGPSVSALLLSCFTSLAVLFW